MISILIPDNNIPERKYIIKSILSDFLGLQHVVIPKKGHQHYSICLNDKELIIKDSFFGLFPKPLSYLSFDALPKIIRYGKFGLMTESNIPIIYGDEEFIISENKITCGLDIFASSYFMLTRWEEYVITERDKHLRFIGSNSMAFKREFLNRPVVNEYVELLWVLFQKMGYEGKRMNRTFELILTHDIDHLDYPQTVKIILGDLLKRKSLITARNNLSQYIVSGLNPYDTFDFIMTNSERIGVRSHFYFISSDTKMPQDPKCYLGSSRFKSKIKEIKERGHIIGFHPGYYTFDNPDEWSIEKKALEIATNTLITEGRQHYLRFMIPDTFRIWNMNNMDLDSSLGYSEYEGFRCGTGDIYHVFDFINREELNIKERPLIIMDSTLRHYRKYNHSENLTIFDHYISIGKKYKSKITLLFHNSSFYGEWVGYKSLYSEVLSISR